jgi:transcription initiation factor IIE alpha subunit
MHHPDTRATDAEPTADRSWGSLPCPRCCTEASITLALDNLCEFTCGECDEAFSLRDVEAIIAAWTPVLAWLRQAPVKE